MLSHYDVNQIKTKKTLIRWRPQNIGSIWYTPKNCVFTFYLFNMN